MIYTFRVKSQFHKIFQITKFLVVLGKLCTYSLLRSLFGFGVSDCRVLQKHQGGDAFLSTKILVAKGFLPNIKSRITNHNNSLHPDQVNSLKPPIIS